MAKCGTNTTLDIITDIAMLLEAVDIVPPTPSVVVPVVISAWCLDLHNKEIWAVGNEIMSLRWVSDYLFHVSEPRLQQGVH